MPNDSKDVRFEELAKRRIRTPMVVQLVSFLRDNKKWWLIPILVVVLLIGVLVLLSGTVAAPFIYTLF